MDEIVFARETLRRALADAIEKLDVAAEKYDPSEDYPTEDVLAGIQVNFQLSDLCTKYAKALTHRIKVRTGADVDA